MSVLELKNNLHRIVVETDDETVLEYINYLFAAASSEKDWWHTISENEQNAISASLKQKTVEKTGIEHQEVRQEMNKILGRAA
jgi:thiamine pyrophosphate-dependent acetolactate synthase large subunit-like protein